MASTPSLQFLPVELIDRILDLLNADQILLSFGHVCRRFHTIAGNYNRLSIKFTTDSVKTNMHRLLRTVQPENIVLLSLKNTLRSSDLIDRFLHSTYIHQLTRLRTLTLYGIKESVLHIVTNPIVALSTIQSLSLTVKEQQAFSRDSVDLLVALIAMPSLRKLTLDVSGHISAQITWPISCSIYELRIRSCSDTQLGHILCHSPNLQSFAVNECNVENIDQAAPDTPYWQLTSLTLNAIPTDMDTFESFLSHFPSLRRLHFQGKMTLSPAFAQRFAQWEVFIGKRLPLLQNFHFCFSFRTHQNIDLESILKPFCTSFWLEDKRWFVTATLSSNSWNLSIRLHTAMYANEKFHTTHYYRTLSYSTTTARSDGVSTSAKEWELRMDSHWLNTFDVPKSHCFQCVNKLHLDIDEGWTVDSLVRLSLLLCLPQLNELWLFERRECAMLSGTIQDLLRQAPNVRILGLLISVKFASRIKSVCAAISSQIDHLKLRVRELKSVKQTFKYLERVRTVTFQQEQFSLNFMPDAIRWLTKKRKRFLTENNGSSVVVKLDGDEDRLAEVKGNRKRMKLTHHRYEP